MINDEAKEIRNGEELNLLSFEVYLNKNVHNFGKITGIKQFPGGKEFMLRAHFGLPSVKNGII